MSIRINDWFVAGNAQKTNSDWNATEGFAQILNKPTNLVHTTGNENIQGIKTFSSIPLSVTPASSSNDRSVATTEFVNNRISIHSGDISAHGDIRQLITNTNENISYSINIHNTSNSSHNDIRQLISSTNDSIITSIDSHNYSTLAHNDIRLSINNNNTLITAVSNDLASETAQRTSEVNNLQQQIDALSSKGDVTDIVGTYQDLENYDTSTLLNKSIIKVLSDSNHDYAPSYYKWNAGTSSFSYIGSEAPTYNKTEIDEMDNLVVHKAGTETITGTKTFKNTVLKCGYKTATSKTDDRYFEIQSYDASNNTRGLYQIWRGTDNTTHNIIRAYNTSGNSCELRAIVADDGSQYTYAPNPSANSSDNNIATTAWVNTTGNNVVHRSGNETIGGEKTFTSTTRAEKSSEGYYQTTIKNTAITVGTAPTSNTGYQLILNDSSGTTNGRIGNLTIYYKTNGNCETYLSAYKPDGTVSTNATLGVVYPASGNPYAYAPTPPEEDNSTKIATTNWCYDPTKSTNLVHRSGDEIIGGTKTFSNTIQGTAYKALWADLAEYYDADNDYKEGTLIKFGGEKEVTAATNIVNAVVSSNPGVILNNESNYIHPCKIALCGKVPVRIIGKVKKFDKIALSYIDGVGCSNNDTEKPIGIALESKDFEEESLILCVVKFDF